MFKSLKNKKYLITGGSGYLGKAISQGMLIAGAELIFLSKNKKKIYGLNFFKKYRNKISIYECDLLKKESLETELKKIKKKFKFLNGVVNVASHVKLGDIDEQDDEDFKKTFQVNVHSVFQVIKEMKNLLKNGSSISKEDSSVVNIGSIYGLVSPDYLVYKKSKFINPISYGCSKASIIHLSKYLATSKQFKKIRVNSISPGPFPNLNSNFKKQIKKNQLINKIPLKRFGTPKEIVGPVIFLLSNHSSYINGTNLVVDGGWTAK